MIVTRVQIKTAKTQKHLYCLVFTKILFAFADGIFIFLLLPLYFYFRKNHSGLC